MAEQIEASNANEGIGKTLRNASAQIVEHVGSVKEAARDTVEKLSVKAPDPYEEVIAEYNAAFTAMYDRGLSLLRQRERSADLIELVELLVNSIANTPKSFETSFHEIGVHKAEFLDAEEFARKDLEAAQQSSVGAALARPGSTTPLGSRGSFGMPSMSCLQLDTRQTFYPREAD